MLDLVIRGGTVVDGTGGPPRAADVGVAAGRVVALGDVPEPATQTIDAGGCIVSPGFIDVHTHYDAMAFWDGTLSPSPLHGVTTVLGGNCGFSIAPLDDEAAPYLMRMLARVEGMPLQSLELGVPWDWRTTGEYLDALEGRLAVNAGFMVGHSALRRVVMGPAAVERTATADEVERMRALLADGLAAGGLGFSSTWSATHNDAEGRPVPSRWADRAELLALASVCADHPGTSLEFLPAITEGFDEDTFELLTSLSLAAQRPVNWNLLVVHEKTLPAAQRRLEAGTYARERGGKVVALTIPMDIVARFTFLTAFALDAIPGWAEPMALPHAQRLALLRDPQARARLHADSQAPGPMRHLGNWGAKVIAETFEPELKRFEGRTVKEIAAEQGKEPFDALLDIVCADDLRTCFTNLPPRLTDGDWAARVQVWRDERALVGGSDAGAHLDFLGTFNYATVLLDEAVRRRGLLPVEEAVHLLTGAPARLYGLVDRGVLTEGAHADLVVWDLERIGSQPLGMRFDLPGGAARLYAESTGVEHVVVGGVPIVSEGHFTAARPGAVLRSGVDTVTPSLS